MVSQTAQLKEISRGTLRTQIYDELRSGIMKGRFEPGQALTVRGLAEIFGTSPTPVREALQQLTAEYAINAEPNRYYRIPVLTREQFLDLRDVRATMEGLAAEKSALIITADKIRKLEALSERMLKAIGKRDSKNYLSANEDFHFVIYEAANAPVLLRTIRGLWLQIGPSLNLLFRDIKLVRSLEDNHKAALTALKKRDSKKARDAVARDILTAAAFLQLQYENRPGGLK